MDCKTPERIARVIERTARVALCGERVIEIGGQTLRADKSTAYVEFFLSHGFPVTTIDGTGIHPQVVANSYRTMLHKVFDLNHLMKEYDPQNNPRDRILGTVVGVEFPATPESGWKVQGERSAAPGIRAVAAMHKQAELVPQLIRQHAEGKPWTVSMEQEYYVGNSGFLVAHETREKHEKWESWEEGEEWAGKTPDDLRDLGWVYVPASGAPMALLDCFDPEKSKITSRFLGRETVILFGGLGGTVRFYGVGLTPAGREKEAAIGQMLASKAVVQEEMGLVELVKATWPHTVTGRDIGQPGRQ